ncbi:transient receptor potential cation channel subfamily A member 1-like [Lytechinus variegatus]|uniref:transient receptor potential cation channel subfamily A member 1-like n=1 Tax=Lytechinus variegatus TaxID=7654 RepID=UPI001BB0F332|nr:transient receptor potential cation channel subfamily A member 1-like [Lytechinus variegatus]
MASPDNILNDIDLTSRYSDILASPKGKLSTITTVNCEVRKGESNEASTSSMGDDGDDIGYRDLLDLVDTENALPRSKAAPQPSRWGKIAGNGKGSKAKAMFKAAALVSGVTAERRFRKANKPSRSKRNQVGSETSLHYDCEEMKETLKPKEDHLLAVNKSYMRLGSVMKLSEAVRRGNVEEVKERLACTKDALLNKHDRNGLTPLHHASASNQIAVMKRLIEQKAEINIKTTDGYSSTPLHLASKRDSVEAVKLLCVHHADIDARQTNGRTPLHVAARYGSKEMVEVIIDFGKSDVNSHDDDFVTPLHIAAIKRDSNLCLALINRGALLQAKDKHSATPLMGAASVGNADTARTLIEMASKCGIKVVDYLRDHDNEENSVLHIAVRSRNLELVEILLQNGANVNDQKSNGACPLHEAAVTGADDIARALLRYGASIMMEDDEGMTSLHRAAMHDRCGMISLLIKEGAEIEHRDDYGFTPLICAAWKGHKGAAAKLFSYGANIEAMDEKMRTCLHWAAENDRPDIIELLMDHGGEQIVNHLDKNDHTALYYAAEVGDLEILKLLVKYGAKLDVRDATGKTALHVAAKMGRQSFSEELLRLCPRLLTEEDLQSQTPLHLASSNRHHYLVQCLLRAGADVSNRDGDYKTSLMLAASNNDVETMVVLIENHADVNAVDSDKNTALHMCCLSNATDAAKLLLENDADLTLFNDDAFTPLQLAIEMEAKEIATAIIRSDKWDLAMSARNQEKLSPMKALIENLPDVAMLVLDKCIQKSDYPPNDPRYTISYNFKYIDPGITDESFRHNGERYAALETMSRYARQELLAHELSKGLVERKWNICSRYVFYTYFFLYFLFAAAMVFLSAVAGRELRYTMDGMCAQINLTSSAYLASIIYRNPEGMYTYSAFAITIVRIYIFAFSVMSLVMELPEFMLKRFHFFLEPGKYLNVILYATAIMYTYPPDRVPCIPEFMFGVMATFLSWVKLFLNLNIFETLGIYVLMFFQTLVTLVKAMAVYLGLIMAFAVSFTMCLQGKVFGFTDERLSVIATFTMLLGEINRGDIFNQRIDLEPFAMLTELIFCIFIFLMPMVLANLTIGISVGDIDGIRKDATLKMMQIQVDNVCTLDRKLPARIQQYFHEEQYTARPNTTLWTLWKGFKRIFFLISDDDEQEETATQDETMAELSEQRTILRLLSVQMKNHGDILRRLAEKEGIDVAILNKTSTVKMR